MSFFKNIITGGNYSKLELSKIELENLTHSYMAFQEDFFLLNKDRHEALLLLKTEREAVQKNITLAKNLISKIKTISNNKKNDLVNDNITYFENINTDFEFNNYSIDFQEKLDNVSESFLNSLSSSFTRLEKKKSYSKNDLKTEFTIVIIDSLISGISNLVKLNKEVKENLRKVNERTSQINDSIYQITSQAPKIYTESKRIIEIAKCLNKHNQVFSMKYENIQKEINNKSKFSLFIDEILNRKITPNENIKKNLHFLIKFSTEYNYLNINAKI